MMQGPGVPGASSSRACRAAGREEAAPVPARPRLGVLQVTEALAHPPSRRCRLRAHYWVLQSPSLLWAILTFFSSFCSSDSATRTSFGFWYYRWARKRTSFRHIPPSPPLHTHTQGPF